MIKDILILFGIPVVIVASLFLFLKKPKCGDGVRGDANYSTFEVIKVETFGETHDYLMFRRHWGCSLTHLPNCRECAERQRR